MLLMLDDLYTTAPWDQLDALSQRENAVTGGQVDYKAMDRDNVLAMPDILRLVE